MEIILALGITFWILFISLIALNAHARVSALEKKYESGMNNFSHCIARHRDDIGLMRSDVSSLNDRVEELEVVSEHG